MVIYSSTILVSFIFIILAYFIGKKRGYRVGYLKCHDLYLDNQESYALEKIKKLNQHLKEMNEKKEFKK